MLTIIQAGFHRYVAFVMITTKLYIIGAINAIRDHVILIIDQAWFLRYVALVMIIIKLSKIIQTINVFVVMVHHVIPVHCIALALVVMPQVNKTTIYAYVVTVDHVIPVHCIALAVAVMPQVNKTIIQQ